QIERPLHEDTYQQGTRGRVASEDHQVSAAGLLDILIVVDNSNSMKPYQGILADRLDPLLSYVTHTNWQIAIVTTDNSCLRGGRTITRADFEADSVLAHQNFRNAISAGDTGSNTERGF